MKKLLNLPGDCGSYLNQHLPTLMFSFEGSLGPGLMASNGHISCAVLAAQLADTQFLQRMERACFTTLIALWSGLQGSFQG